MNDLGTALQEVLTADAAVSALVGANVWPAHALSDSAPAMRVQWQIIDTVPLHAQSGEVGWREARVQVDSRAFGRLVAHAIADAVHVALSDVTGLLGHVPVQRMHLDSELELPEPPVSGGQQAVHRFVQDYTVWYKE